MVHNNNSPNKATNHGKYPPFINQSSTPAVHLI